MPFDVTEFMGGSSLKHTDLSAPQQTMTIEGVGKRKYDEGTPKETTKVIVKFQEHAKPLGLNVTNVGRIAQLYGMDADGWVGKTLKVFRTVCNFQGKRTLCIRIVGPNDPLPPGEVLCHASGDVVTAPEQPGTAPQQQPAAPQQQQPVNPDEWSD